MIRVLVQVADRRNQRPVTLFKAMFGETPHRYRSRAQIEKARHLLILTDLSITDVCLSIGSSSVGSFSTLFLRRVGMSPSEFQRRCRSAPADRQLPAGLIPGCPRVLYRRPGLQEVQGHSGWGILAAFEVDNIEAEANQLKKHGVKFTMDPAQQGPVKLAIFSDTCGNLIQMYEPAQWRA